jgi:hypothetical protein
MYKARAFFFVCAGIFLLALAYHFGALNAGAQVGSSNPVVAAIPGGVGTFSDYTSVFTANGDHYGWNGFAWVHRSNVFSGPTPATQPTWGQLKSRYRPGAATQDK